MQSRELLLMWLVECQTLSWVFGKVIDATNVFPEYNIYLHIANLWSIILKKCKLKCAIVGLCRNTEESVTILCLSFFQWKNEGRLWKKLRQQLAKLLYLKRVQEEKERKASDNILVQSCDAVQTCKCYVTGNAWVCLCNGPEYKRNALFLSLLHQLCKINAIDH